MRVQGIDLRWSRKDGAMHVFVHMPTIDYRGSRDQEYEGYDGPHSALVLLPRILLSQLFGPMCPALAGCLRRYRQSFCWGAAPGGRRPALRDSVLFATWTYISRAQLRMALFLLHVCCGHLLHVCCTFVVGWLLVGVCAVCLPRRPALPFKRKRDLL